jgi:hypothetical protein
VEQNAVVARPVLGSPPAAVPEGCRKSASCFCAKRKPSAGFFLLECVQELLAWQKVAERGRICCRHGDHWVPRPLLLLVEDDAVDRSQPWEEQEVWEKSDSRGGEEARRLPAEGRCVEVTETRWQEGGGGEDGRGEGCCYYQIPCATTWSLSRRRTNSADRSPGDSCVNLYENDLRYQEEESCRLSHWWCPRRFVSKQKSGCGGQLLLPGRRSSQINVLQRSTRICMDWHRVVD